MFDKTRAITIMLIAFVLGIAVLAAGISGRIVMGRITDEIMSTEYVSSMDEAIYGFRDVLNRGIGGLALKLTVSVIKNDSTGFTKAVKEVVKSIGSIGDSSGIGDLVLSPIFEEVAAEAFQEGRRQLVESAGSYMPLLQFAAYYSELLIIGGIISGVSLLLWFLMGGSLRDLKRIKIVAAIGIAWIVVVIVMTATMLNEVKKPLFGESSANTPAEETEGCNHDRTTVLNERAATCAEKGYSGDQYCEDCQTVIMQGEETSFGDHQYENGVCVQCGWRVPGLYVGDSLIMTWDQLVDNSYITVNENRIHKVLKTLQGVLVVEDGYDVDGEAFYESALDEVWMPRTYTRIKSSAFYGANIPSIVFWGKIEGIGEAAFKRSGLRSVSIPEGVIAIPSGCFSECEQLEDVNLPDSVESLGGYAFADCTKLKSIVLPNRIKTIESQCFAGSGLETITISESVAEIGGSCFINCRSLKTVDMSRCAVEVLKKATFMACTELKNITLPDHLIDIDSAFYEENCIEYLILPETVKHVSLGSNYMYPMESLRWVVWPTGLLDASGFESATNLEVVYYMGSEYQWSLVTGKEYDRPFEPEDTDIFKNVKVFYNCTEADWTGRLQTDNKDSGNKAILWKEASSLEVVPDVSEYQSLNDVLLFDHTEQIRKMAQNGENWTEESAPKSIDALSYFPRQIISLYNALSDVTFSIEKKRTANIIHTNVGELLSGKGEIYFFKSNGAVYEAEPIDENTYMIPIEDDLPFAECHWSFECRDDGKNVLEGIDVDFAIEDGKLINPCIVISVYIDPHLDQEHNMFWTGEPHVLYQVDNNWDKSLYNTDKRIIVSVASGTTDCCLLYDCDYKLQQFIMNPRDIK